jgi:hypothetical protein
MKHALVRFICRILIVSLTSLSIGAANAGIVTVEQVASTDRAVVLDFLSRDEVANALQARGVDPGLARERAASMTDAEIAAVKERIDTLPAGAFASGGEVGLALAGVILLVAAIIWAIVNALRK